MKLKDWSLAVVILPLLLVGCGDDTETTDKTDKSKLASPLPLTRAQSTDGTSTPTFVDLTGAALSDLQVARDATSTTTHTYSKDGFLRTSILGSLPTKSKLQIPWADSPEPTEIQGEVINFGAFRTMSRTHFALVLPQIAQNRLQEFQLNRLVSPEADTLSVFGQSLEIPSNLALPQQTILFGLPMTISKPKYRIFASPKQVANLTALHGHFPLASVIRSVHGGSSIIDLINNFEFVSVGNADIATDGKLVSHDIAVDQKYLNSVVKIKAPLLTDNQIMFAVALAPVQDRYFATDLKRVSSEQTQRLMTVDGDTEKFALAILKNADQPGVMQFQQLSLAFQPFKETTTPIFLDLIDKPTFNSGSLKMTPPKSVAGIAPLGTYAVLSELTRTDDDPTTERALRLWQVFVPTWVDAIPLPKVEIVKKPSRIYRWDVMYLGCQGEATRDNVFENVTHLTRHSVDL